MIGKKCEEKEAQLLAASQRHTPPSSALETCVVGSLHSLEESRAHFPADTHKPGHLAWEKKNGSEQENIFSTHYSHRSHREGAGTEPSGRTTAWKGLEEARLALKRQFSRSTGSQSRSHASEAGAVL